MDINGLHLLERGVACPTRPQVGTSSKGLSSSGQAHFGTQIVEGVVFGVGKEENVPALIPVALLACLCDHLQQAPVSPLQFCTSFTNKQINQ